MPRKREILAAIAALVALATALQPTPASARGKYERRRAHRGEQTDTSAKVSRHGFLDDAEESPRRLAVHVDAAAARSAEPDPDLLALRVGVAFRGWGTAITVSPDRFRLRWEGAPGISPLDDDTLVDRDGGLRALRLTRRRLETFGGPIPFTEHDGIRLATRFHRDPTRTAFVEETARLSPSTWFADLLFFELPAGAERWTTLFVLELLDDDGSPLADCRFRVEPDPEVHRDAFRRARKGRRKEDRQGRKARAREAREAADARSGASSASGSSDGDDRGGDGGPSGAV